MRTCPEPAEGVYSLSLSLGLWLLVSFIDITTDYGFIRIYGLNILHLYICKLSVFCSFLFIFLLYKIKRAGTMFPAFCLIQWILKSFPKLAVKKVLTLKRYSEVLKQVPLKFLSPFFHPFL